MCKTNATYRGRFTRPLKARLAPLISSKDRAVMLLYHVPSLFADVYAAELFTCRCGVFHSS